MIEQFHLDIDGLITSITNLCQSRLGSNDNKGVLYLSKWFSVGIICKASSY